jgi:hypothetical protein
MPYILAYPNDEVRSGFTKSLLVYYSGQGTSAYSTLISDIINGFKQHNIDFVMNSIRAYMSRVPYDAEKQNELHYKTIIYCVFSLALPYFVRCEEKSAAGKSDIVVETDDSVYVMEFKLNSNGSVDDALKQIDDKGYLIPYTVTCCPNGKLKSLYKIGIAFDSEKRTIGEWKVVG